MSRPETLVTWVTALAPALLATALCATRPAFTAPVERGGYDMLVRALPLRPPSDRIVIVDIDELSLASVGQWPWSRSTMGRLLDGLRQAGTTAIALDVMFAEPQRDAGGHDRGDADLAETVAAGGVVLGYAFRFDPHVGPTAPCLMAPPPLTRHERGDVSGGGLFEARATICNVPAIQAAARHGGYLNAAPDSDGILRRVPVFVSYQGQAYPSLALAAVQQALAVTSTTLVTGHPQAGHVHLATANPATPLAPIPLDGTGSLLLRYRGPKHTLRYLSAVDVLEGRVAPEALRGRIAFVGTTALGTREVVATPLDTLFTGVEVQATAADNLLQGDALRRREDATMWELVACLGSSLAVVPWFRRGRTLLGTAGGAAVLSVLWGGAFWLLAAQGLVFSPVYATVGLIVSAATAGALAAADARRGAQRANAAAATSQELLVETLLSLTEIKDQHTGAHSRRIELYTRLLARQLARDPALGPHLLPAFVERLARLSVLHDIGKVGVPRAILNKPGRLTPEEFEQVKQHPRYGYDVIARAERAVGVTGDATLELAKEIVYTHHERWDGDGYPQGLAGEAIPLPGRIIALVDVYDALVSDRPYRPGMPHDQVQALIVDGRGTHFDPRIVDAFVSVAPAFAALATRSQGDAAGAPRAAATAHQPA